MTRRHGLLAVFLAGLCAVCWAQPAYSLRVFKMKASPNPTGMMFGTYPRAGSVTPHTVLDDVGMFPIQRVSWDRWSWIETSPGVYDWNKAEFSILVESHKFGSEAIGSVYMADKIPSFYPQDINAAATRQAAANFVKAYYLEMQRRLGKVWVVIDYEMQWYDFAVAGIDPDEWASWYVMLVNEVKSVIPDATVICDVIADDHDYYLPGSWLTTAMSVSDVLGVDDYGLTPQIIHDDIQWLIDNYAGGKPIYILENGFSTWQGVNNKAHGTEEEQAAYFEDVINDVMTNFTGSVKSYVQFMYPDAGTGDNIEYHWGLVTYNNGREKPALDVFRQAYATHPACTVEELGEITDSLEAQEQVPVTWNDGTNYEFLSVEETINLSTVKTATLDVDFTDSDGTGEFLVEVNGHWKYASSSSVNVSDLVVHGINTINIYFPQEVWPGSVDVKGVDLVLDSTTDPVSETFEVYLDTEDLTLHWDPYLNVFPWLLDTGAPMSHQGQKSMAVSYTCTMWPYWGSVTREFTPPQDWSYYQGFGFYVKGTPGNSAEKIRVVIKDTSGAIIESCQFFGMTAVTDWTRCDVWFSGIPESERWRLAGVKKVEISVVGQSRGSGTVYVDDLFCSSIADTLPPLLMSVDPITPTYLVVKFSEPVTLSSIKDIANYSIVDEAQAPLNVLNAVDITDNMTVLLATEEQSAVPYLLRVDGVEDVWGNAVKAGVADTLTFMGNNTPITGVGDGPRGPRVWLQAAPNPFRSGVAISYGLDREVFGGGPVHVSVDVYDVRGRLVRSLVDDSVVPGPYRVSWDGRTDGGSSLPAGVYFLRMQGDGFHLDKRVILAK
jgi:hypothetical protein